jgi:hypothetical protein
MTRKLPIIVTVLLCLACRLNAVESGGLEMTVTYSQSEYEADRIRDDFAVGEGHVRYDFYVVLRNMGTTPLVALKGKNFSGFGTINEPGSEPRHEMAYVWSFNERDIPSESELGLVKLLPGEAARLRVAIRTNEKIAPKSITFIYIVDEKLAARFGTWGGRLETVVLDQMEMRLLKEKQRREQKNTPEGQAKRP